MKPRYVIGIDPGVSTGYAVWDREEKTLTNVTTLEFWGAFERAQLLKPGYVEIIIEDPTGNLPTFAKAGDGTARKREKISQNVGSNKREAQLLIEGLRRRGYTVRTVTPTKKKWDVETFRRLTGYAGQTSQHSRDAARLVWGL